MVRARFRADPEDYRPVKWPPPGPYWCSGQAGNGSYSIVVAYADSEEQINEFWPEASHIYATEETEMVFTDRFPKPEWWV